MKNLAKTKLAVGRPRKEDGWKVELVKLYRKEESVIEKAQDRKKAIRILLNGDGHGIE